MKSNLTSLFYIYIFLREVMNLFFIPKLGGKTEMQKKILILVMFKVGILLDYTVKNRKKLYN